MRQADFAVTLRAFVRRHPDAGYGGMFLKWAFTDGAPAYGSWGNGAPMRVAAVGWLAGNADEADALAAAQSEVSHSHTDAVKAAQAVARAILALRQGCSVPDVRAWVSESWGYDLRPEVALKGGCFDVSAAGTSPPALTAAFESADWEEAVRTSVCLGGDTDTLACIAGAVAEAIHGVPGEIVERARHLLTDDLRDVLNRFTIRLHCG